MKAKAKSSQPIPKKLALTVQFYGMFSARMSKKLALKLFFTPLKFPTPEREVAYKSGCITNREIVNNKSITVYQVGIEKQKVLLVHGWSGRATQFFKIAPALKNAGYKVISFTAPAHGSSTDKQTHLHEITDCIQHLEKSYGPFDAVLGHSLGATAILNAINKGMTTKKVIAIGASGFITEIVQEFCKNIGFNQKVETFLLEYLKENYTEDYEQFSFTRLAEKMTIPCLIIHDENDKDVDIANARQNHIAWINSELMETKGLGHRLILSDESVINRILTFLS